MGMIVITSFRLLKNIGTSRFELNHRVHDDLHHGIPLDDHEVNFENLVENST